MDAHHARNPASPVFATGSRTAFGMSTTQPPNHLGTQFATRHGVDRGIDGFVRNLQRGRIGMHPCKCASDLLGRVAPFQIVHDLVPQCASRIQASLYPWGDATLTGTLLRGQGAIPSRYDATLATVSTDTAPILAQSPPISRPSPTAFVSSFVLQYSTACRIFPCNIFS